MYLSTGASIVNIKKKKELKIHFLNNTHRNTKQCVFQQEPVLSILKIERIKNTLLNNTNRNTKLCIFQQEPVLSIYTNILSKYIPSLQKRL